MRLNKLATLPEYTDGCFNLYDIVDVDDERKIRERGIGPVCYRDIGVYDRTRITFEQADKAVSMKIRMPKWDGSSSDCVCVVNGQQHKGYNKADVLSNQGYPETELTLVNPTMEYEVTT